ncbi:MAG: UDP-N-acetylmuramoyl-L-alanyl-D-glutamate--2,6-diaminopimelate ligase [Oribacterium sp.]|nr:UDP-N-acetylmuramoyl-L-alanyl-D-glutamate--2,6-diaminopimelate ligase [Oribacterium sp.]
MPKFSDWLNDINYTVVHGNPDKVEVSEVVFDSRKAAPETVFVCMKGANVDSHSFLPEVIRQGTSAIVVEEESEKLPVSLEDLPDGVALIRVDSAREALAKLSAARFGYPAREMTVIAVTGTKGKTTTAHMIRSILETAGKRCGIIGTTGVEYCGRHFETKNTTPESYDLHSYFRKMRDAGCEYLVMEASSQGFKLHRTDGIQFDYGIFTNIEPDHIGPNEHKDFAEYKYYKSMIFRQSKVGLLNLDADYADELLQNAPCKMYTFALDRTADFMGSSIEHVHTDQFTGVEFQVRGRNRLQLDVKLDLPGRYNVYNAMAAISVCSLIGIDSHRILEAMRYVKVDGRVEIAFKNSRMTVIVDYAHNAMAMENLLSTLRAYHPKRLVVVFGCGGNRSKERRYGMGETAAKMADLSILTADNSRYEKTEDIINDIKSTLVPAGGKYVEVPDRREAIQYAMTHAEDGDMIAVIGKGHEDYNEVNGVRTHFLDREVIEETARQFGL